MIADRETNHNLLDYFELDPEKEIMDGSEYQNTFVKYFISQQQCRL